MYVYAYIHIYRVELGQRRYIRLGFCCGTPFFARRAQYKDVGGMGERQRKRNRHKGGWVHRSETRACLSTPQCARKYTLPGIYYYTCISLLIRKTLSRNETSLLDDFFLNLPLYSLYVISLANINTWLLVKSPCPSCV